MCPVFEIADRLLPVCSDVCKCVCGYIEWPDTVQALWATLPVCWIFNSSESQHMCFHIQNLFHICGSFVFPFHPSVDCHLKHNPLAIFATGFHR